MMLHPKQTNRGRVYQRKNFTKTRKIAGRIQKQKEEDAKIAAKKDYNTAVRNENLEKNVFDSRRDKTRKLNIFISTGNIKFLYDDEIISRLPSHSKQEENKWSESDFEGILIENSSTSNLKVKDSLLSSECIWNTINNRIDNILQNNATGYEYIIALDFVIMSNALVAVNTEGSPLSINQIGNEYYNVIPLLNSDETFEHKTFHNLNESHMDFLRNNIDVPRLTTILQLKKQNSTIWNDLKDFRLINLQKFIYFKCFGHMRWRTESPNEWEVSVMKEILNELGHPDLFSFPEDLFNDRPLNIDPIIETADNVFPSLYQYCTPNISIIVMMEKIQMLINRRNADNDSTIEIPISNYKTNDNMKPKNSVKDIDDTLQVVLSQSIHQKKVAEKKIRYWIDYSFMVIYVRSDFIRVRYRSYVKDYPSYSLANPELDHIEQSSDEIWETILNIIKTTNESIPDDNGDVHVLFVTEESLVLLNECNESINISGSITDKYNVIPWMDVRARQEAKMINMRYGYQKVSPYSLASKVLWLKNHPTIWDSIKNVMNLNDFLTMKASGSMERFTMSSLSNLMNDKLESIKFYSSITVLDFIPDKINLDNDTPFYPGKNGSEKNMTDYIKERCGFSKDRRIRVSSITEEYAHIQLYLKNKIALKIIDDKPSFVILGDIVETNINEERILNNIRFIGAIELNTFDSTFNGKLIDHLIRTHPCFLEINDIANGDRLDEYLNNRIFNNILKYSELSKNFYIVPDLMQYPESSAIVIGVKVMPTIDNLIAIYMAIIESFAFVYRQVIEVSQLEFGSIFVTGVLSSNRLFTGYLTLLCGLPVYVYNNESITRDFTSIIKYLMGVYGGHAEGNGIGRKFIVANHIKGLEKNSHRKYEFFVELLKLNE